MSVPVQYRVQNEIIRISKDKRQKTKDQRQLRVWVCFGAVKVRVRADENVKVLSDRKE